MSKPQKARRIAALYAAPLLLAGTSTAAAAQPGTAAAPGPAPSEASSGLDDIVVTAQRRSELVQTTPIAISAFSGETLQQRKVISVEGLNTMVPNLTFARYAGVAQVAIRGVAFDTISPGSEGRTAIYNDGVYVSRPSAGLANFFDVERIEVLRGPQGTLYGRNATAGALNIISRDPTDELEGYGEIMLGNYRQVRFEGAIGGPLAPGVAARIAVQTVDRSGFGKNIVSGGDVDDERSRGVRGKLLFEPSETLSIKLTGDYSLRDDSSSGRHDLGAGRPGVTPRGILLGGAIPTNPRDIAGYQPFYNREIYGAAADITLQLSDQLELVSITGYRHLDVTMDGNTDGSTKLLSPQRVHEDSNQYSEELRLSGDFGPLKLLLGGYYFREVIHGFSWSRFDGAAAFPPSPTGQVGTPGVIYYGANFGGTLRTNASAVFGQADWDITRQLTLTIGGRYSHERKTVDEYSVLDLTTPAPSFDVQRTFVTIHNKASFSSFTPKVTLNYKPNPNMLIYATYSQGFKSGGFALGSRLPAFRPEKLKSYEGGIKVDLLDRRLRVNLAGFYYDYINLQVTKIDGTVITTENAADATVKGLEAEIRVRPTDGLDLGFNGALLDAEFDNFLTAEPARPQLGVQSLAGNSIAQSPRRVFTFDGSYRWAIGSGEANIRGDVTYKSRTYFSAYNRPEISQPPFTLVNAAIGYKTASDLEFTAFVRNLTNKLYFTSKTVGNVFAGFTIGNQVGDPRTFGISVRKSF